MTDAIPPLAGAFRPANHDDWRDLVEKALKGASLDDRLVSRTRDGIALQPVYERARAAPAQPAPAHDGAWTIVQRIEHPDIDEAGDQIGADLAGGAGGIELVFAGSLAARGAGIGVETLDDLDRLLSGVDLTAVELWSSAGYESRQVAALIAALLERRGTDPGAVRLRLVHDPIGNLALKGFLNAPEDALNTRLADMFGAVADSGLNAQLLTPDGRWWHHGGASEAQELAIVLASAVHYMRGLESHGPDADEVSRRIGFSLAADADQFMTIAKVRALRRLWARLCEAAGLPARPVHVHAETAWRMMSARDPYVNMLRGTLAVFSAGVAGADSVAALPFTAALGVPDAFARRVARNMQVLLIEEANLYRVADPAAGSGAVEALTDTLAREAWRLFQAIEKQGGMLAALKAGAVQRMVAETRAARFADVCRLWEPMIGVNQFAELQEQAPAVLAVAAAELSATNLRLSLPEPGQGRQFRALVEAAGNGVGLTDMGVSQASNRVRIDETVPQFRVAEPFEALRAASDRELSGSGARPHVFLARFGAEAEHGARADWVRSVFAAGGLVAQDDQVFASTQAAVIRFRELGAPLACICASDAAYGEHAAAAAGALREAGARAVILAGDPGPARAAYEAAGIGMFLYKGCNVVRLMADALAAAGIGVDFGPLGGLVDDASHQG